MSASGRRSPMGDRPLLAGSYFDYSERPLPTLSARSRGDSEVDFRTARSGHWRGGIESATLSPMASSRLPQMRFWILGFFILAFCQEATAAAAADSVVSGRAISNMYMDHVKIDCPKGDICMDAWFRWSIDVAKTLRGPSITGRVIAVRMQHSTVIPSYERRLRSFVLRPIDDPKQRALLRSDYYLVSTSFAVAAAEPPPMRGHAVASAHAKAEVPLSLSQLADCMYQALRAVPDVKQPVLRYKNGDGWNHPVLGYLSTWSDGEYQITFEAKRPTGHHDNYWFLAAFSGPVPLGLDIESVMKSWKTKCNADVEYEIN